MTHSRSKVIFTGLLRVVQLIAFMLCLGAIVHYSAGKPTKDIKARQVELLSQQVSELTSALKDCQDARDEEVP